MTPTPFGPDPRIVDWRFFLWIFEGMVDEWEDEGVRDGWF